MERGETRSTPISSRHKWVQRGANYFGMPRAEFLTAAGFLALMIVFKMVNMMRYHFDSDESQHMHVIWGWARGLVQYRDLFDNHMPLFQILFAPIFGLIGDRPTILYWMRFILLPMYFVAAWSTYQIGTRLFSRRVGIWAVLLAGLYMGYHFTSFEFRTDNLWAPLWLLCVLVLIDGAMSVRRALVAGLLLGLCFGVSMKSTLLFLSIVAGALIATLFVGPRRLGLSRLSLARCIAAFLIATAIVPAVIMFFFACNGVWPNFRYCVLDHNILPHYSSSKSPPWLIFIFPVAFPVVAYTARIIVRAAPNPAQGFRRGFVFLTCGFYLPALYSFWNLVTRQDFLPYHPLAFLFVTAAVIAFSDNAKFLSTLSPRLRRLPLPGYVAGVVFLVTLLAQPFWIDGAKAETNLLRDVLRLTEPGDYIFDCKGETIFRRRCFRPVLEPITFERIQRNLIVDDAAERCVETQTCVAASVSGAGGRLPWGARRFVMKNYLPVRKWVRVVGGYLEKSAAQPGALEFQSVIPTSYEIIARDGGVRGILDGTVYSGARFLSPGRHLFIPATSTGTLAFLWARAVDLHYSPFDLVPTEVGMAEITR
jgi:hypothetical protein